MPSCPRLLPGRAALCCTCEATTLDRSWVLRAVAVLGVDNPLESQLPIRGLFHSLFLLGDPEEDDAAGDEHVTGLELGWNILNVGLSSSLASLKRFLGGVQGSSVSLELHIESSISSLVNRFEE